MNQKEALLKHLKKCTKSGISQYEATEKLCITNLAERVRELERTGYIFERKKVTGLNRFNNKVTFYRYVLTDFSPSTKAA